LIYAKEKSNIKNSIKSDEKIGFLKNIIKKRGILSRFGE